VTFAEPWALALLATTPIAVALHIYLIWRRQRVAHRFAQPERFGELSSGEGVAGILLRGTIIAAATALLAVAVAQPRWGTSETETTRQGADIVVVLDISLSMNARDVDPDRLGQAKEDIASLISRLQGDRVGLVVFAGESVVRFPLTDDEQSALQVVEDVTTTSILGEGSAVASGIETAAELLTESPAESRVMVLYSDGENFGAAPIEAAFAAAQSGITIHTVGVGTEAGSTIPVFDSEQQVEVLKIDGRTGQPAVTRLDPALLRGTAEAGGGRYLELSRPNESVAAELAADVRRLEQTTFGAQTATLPVERFQLFAGLAFTLLLIERLVWRPGTSHSGSSPWRLTCCAARLMFVRLVRRRDPSWERTIRRGGL
jgi:Ca-activated chloride channel homolog